MTTEHQASRTLVKSPPELWAECSDAGSLARHIGEFGEIRITRVEPETSLSWEAEHASGTVEIEPSGWGTRVTLTAQTKASGVVIEAAEVRVPGVDPAGVGPAEEADLTAEPNAGVVQEALDPPENESNAVEEVIDAKVEETVAQSDPAVAAGPVRAGGRWRRLIARGRAWFGTPGQASETTGDPPGAEIEGVAEPEPAAAVAEPAAETEPATGAEPAILPEPSDAARPADDAAGAASLDPEAVLMAALESLGQAHHRPFSRA
jgi:hypothetical protein